MSQSQEKIIERMKKLLAMSEGNANEHEALIAAKRLHIMLAKHNISMADLSTEENPVGQDGFDSYNAPWKRHVGLAIAKLYFCSYYFVPSYNNKKKATMMFVGTDTNRIFAIHIMKLIVKTIEREARAESRKRYGRENCGFVNSFWTGAMDRIVARCDELVKSAKAGTLQDEDGNTLPVLLSVYESSQLAVTNWKDENLNLKTAKANVRATNANGLASGRAAGNRVQLSRSLQSNSQKLLGN